MANTRYYSAELMVYFEKHRFLEVLRALMVRIGIDRPSCVKHYIRNHIRKIASSVLTKNTIVHLPSQFDVEKFVNMCIKPYNIPVITYNTRGKKVDAKKLNEILKKFQRFCQQNGLYLKNKIYLNIPNNFDEVLQIENCESPPTNFVHVEVDDAADPDFKEVLDFYKYKSKEVPDQFSPNDAYNTKDFEKQVISEVMYKIKYSSHAVPYNIDANFVYRIAIIGRRGSGRETQAKMLAERYNLVYVNMNLLLQYTLQRKDNLAKVLCISFKREGKFSSSAIISVLWRRLLQRDTLSKGWVIVGFPSCLEELKIFVEKFQIPPNRFVVIHCSKTVALQRLILKWEKIGIGKINKRNTCLFAEKESIKFDEDMKAVYEYLKTCKTKTVHVNGSCCMCYVKNKIFSLCQR